MDVTADITPMQMLRSWPVDKRLVALCSGRFHPRWARWSILAEPVETIEIDADPAAVREALDLLDATLGSEPSELPFTHGWTVELHYELGCVFEPRANQLSHAGPVMRLHRCDGALVYDHATKQWHRTGSTPPEIPDASVFHPPNASIQQLASRTGSSTYCTLVERALEYIASGDIYQANLSHVLKGRIEGAWRSLAADKLESLGPWYGGYIESTPRSAILSCSPELFLSVDATTRNVCTRPIKGTRPATADPRELLDSDKDAAELAMIVDLMRNDLGRVCSPGSVHVPSHREIEYHGSTSPKNARGVMHAVSAVAGHLREDEGFGSLVRACFPAGSITGAPKIRAMQIIEELEQRSRGAYCGSIGYVSASGHACLNVGIRTASLCNAHGAHRNGTIEYPVGAGIVAQSEPSLEWEETMHKAAGFQNQQSQLPKQTPEDVAISDLSIH